MRREIHALTHGCLDVSNNTALAEAGQLLKDLQARSIDADYELEKRNVENARVVDDCLQTADEIFDMISGELSEEERRKTRRHIEPWPKIKYGGQ